MKLEETPEAAAWLLQFKTVDREVARQLLRRLTLISESEFDRNLQVEVEKIIARVGNENIALFSITEPPNPFDTDQTRRIKGSSTDRIKHIIENISRVHGNRVRANPTVESMRSERIRNIVLVEDFIGTGDRITGYWKNSVSGSLKSWVSFRWTKVWLVTYAGLQEGFNAARTVIPLSPDRTLSVLPRKDDRLALTNPMRALADKYGRPLRGRAWFGYGEGGGTVIFQHGCPNNTPAILWAQAGRFNPIFPNRGIPTGLQHCFGAWNEDAIAEILWDFRQYYFALSLAGEVVKKRPDPSTLMFAVALALSSSYGVWDDEKIRSQLSTSMDSMNRMRSTAYKLNMLDKNTHRLTPFGREMVRQLQSERPRRRYKTPKALPYDNTFYYPKSCGGTFQF